MATWPRKHLPPLVVITPFSEEAYGNTLDGPIPLANAPTSAAFVANRAYYYPFCIETESTARKLFLMNGASVAGDIDVGIYDEEFNKIVSSGATAQSGTNAIQELDITDTLLPPGNYWLAVSCSSTGAQFGLQATDEVAMSQLVLYTEESAHPLPTTATPVKAAQTVPRIVLVGIAFDTLI